MAKESVSGGNRDKVGPVLQAGQTGEAIVDAIRQENEDVEVQDHGSYFRVLVPGRCSVTKQAIEAALGREFRMPGELEGLMSSFKGRVHLSEDEAVWELLGKAQGDHLGPGEGASHG